MRDSSVGAGGIGRRHGAGRAPPPAPGPASLGRVGRISIVFEGNAGAAVGRESTGGTGVAVSLAAFARENLRDCRCRLCSWSLRS